MKHQVKKFLEFNGKAIFFVAADGQYWIAIKPICEALNVDYIRQFKNLKDDEILGQLLSEQTIVAADGKERKMVSLPEFYVYGWIFQIQSLSPELVQYKWECYKVLYEHFHGSITGRKSLLKEKAKAQLEIEEIFNNLDLETAIRYDRARRKVNQVNAQLRELDVEAIQEEKNLFTN